MHDFVVTGAGGMLGRSWTHRLEASGARHLAAPRSLLDISDDDAVARLVTKGTRWVINCAAWTDVDGAEAKFDAASEANGHAVGRLANRCKEVGAAIVHYSTDYVFDGRADRPYAVDHRRDPVNAYGRSKALGEELLEASGVDYLLVRSSWLYAPWGKNFVLTMRDLTKSRPKLRVVDDQRGRPSSCDHIADATLALIERGEHGVFHVSDGGECTWFELASQVRDLVDPTCVIEPCTSEEFPRPAPRPPYSVLDLSKTEQRLGPIEGWRTRVAEVLKAS
ncbi:MAG: dTDP-4-dehydrorhamnose reductase [Myxococcota bacterium]